MDSSRSESDRIAEIYGRRSGASRYTPFDPAHLWSLHEVESNCLSLLRAKMCGDLADFAVLDVGCGGGYWLRRMVDWGIDPCRLHGVDVLPERVERARSGLPRSADVRELDAARLPWPDAKFDLVSQFVVFSSIIGGDQKLAVAREMARVVKPDGTILWYDFRVDNPRNPDVAGVTADEVRHLFPGFDLVVRRITLAPPLARLLAPRALWFCRAIAVFPWVRTHLLIALTRTDQSQIGQATG